MVLNLFISVRLTSLRCATIDLAFGLQAITKLIAWKAASFEIDFILRGA